MRPLTPAADVDSKGYLFAVCDIPYLRIGNDAFTSHGSEVLFLAGAHGASAKLGTSLMVISGTINGAGDLRAGFRLCLV